ncbi:PolC-type DNA polymerase III [Clostridiaceae bacterium HSG29]|nr:PolC-type DNA polymerase III [Clostridiaceae bacterium HSG29]
MNNFNKIVNNFFDENLFDITSIKYNKSEKSLKIIIVFKAIILNDKFNELKKQVNKDLFFLDEIIINKKYDIKIDDNKKFFVNNINQIISSREKIPSRFLSVLTNSTKTFKNDVLIFKIKDHIVYKRLVNAKIDVYIKDIIKNEFSIDIFVEFQYEEIIEETDSFNENKTEAVNKLLSEMKSKRENIKKTVIRKPSDNNANKSGEIYKGKIKREFVKINSIKEEGETVAIKGKVFNVDSRELRGGKTLIMLSVTDLTSSIGVKIFAKPNTAQRILSEIKKGSWYGFEGNVTYDKFEKELVIFINKINYSQNFDSVIRMDEEDVKRVELHMHTKMSAMDGMNDVKDLIKRAQKWGHKGIAITDHGVLQAFPDAMRAKGDDFKIIYGVEGYLFNDNATLVINPNEGDLNQEFVIFDIETTGLNKQKDDITEIGAVMIRNKQIIKQYSTFVKPTKKIPEIVIELTGITNEMVENERPINEVLPEFLEFVGNRPLVAHNAIFDIAFIDRESKKLNLEFNPTILDTMTLSKMLLKKIKRFRLKTVANHLKVKLEGHHRAINDAAATALIFIKLLDRLEKKDVYTVKGINELAHREMDYKTHDTYHVIILVKNYIGLKNLYKLVSESNIETFYKQPRISKSSLKKYREGLIIGTACEAGELYRAVINNKSEDEIKEIASFYDYLEVQPNGNNQFLIDNNVVENISDLQDINKRIIDLGDELNKLVVATGDVHFLDKEDAVYRKILMAGKGFRDADNQPPLYLKTTREMLDDFNYLDDKKAYEIVVENTNKIFDEIEDILPIPNGTFPPSFAASDEELREMCYKKAKSIYSDNLPEIVEKRLEVELSSIIDNGYSVMYIIAQKLVDKSMEDGYLVGSRGSVGSSFAATMSNITEVNPLPPHYICTKCKKSEFILDGSLGSGVDLPDKECPDCHIPYKKDGHDIPFEVFLGFGGGKEPDIDLNFAGVYQAKAHKYTEVLFGEGKTFKAGTIGTIADKTAYGYVAKYFEEREITVRRKEIERLAIGCTGVKRTSGQHPGGIMVVPRDKDIYDFCPIQYPANDTESDVITTHFDYHSISGRLLKLDLLGHDVPTMIKELEDLTDVKIDDVALDDKETMSIFTSVESLKIKDPSYKLDIGSLGIPEFGTVFVRQMLEDTQPKAFSDLVRISGLSHGTDVWVNNAQDLVRQGVVKINEVISTRDDIMNYLIYNGLPSKESFVIMESVRKGKGLNEEQLELMKKNDIPKWYIESCQKIKYMFPKAHAVAYVMMSFRIAYFKVHYPLAFYATFFSGKVTDFDAHAICGGPEKVKRKMSELTNGERMTKKEKDQYAIYEIAIEMYARGFEFLKVDLYKSHYEKFLIEDGKLLPPLSSLEGVGGNAAYSIYDQIGKGEFISIEDLKDRTKLTSTGVETLRDHGALVGLSEMNQLSMF